MTLFWIDRLTDFLHVVVKITVAYLVTQLNIWNADEREEESS